MYASFRYAIRKAATVKSTWFILLIAIGLMIGLAGILPFNINYRRYALDPNTQYLLSTYVSYAIGVGSILTLIIAVFAGFKGAAMFRDEIEDGSLLIMLSKPITRSTLIFSKWLAYITVLAVFCLIVSLSHALGIGIGTNFTANAVNLIKGIFLELAFALIFSLIFAGIALFFSTILTATQTAVTVLVFGILSPLTSVIQPVTATPEYVAVATTYRAEQKSSVADFLKYRVATADGTVRQETTQEFLERVTVYAVTAAGDKTAAGLPARQGVVDLIAFFKELGVTADAPANPAELTVSYVVNLFTQLRSVDGGDLRLPNLLVTSLYVPAQERNTYLPLRFIDFNGQASALSDYVTDAIFSAQTISDVATVTYGRVGQQTLRTVADLEVTPAMINRMHDDIAAFSPPSAGKTAPAQPSEAERQAELNRFFANIGGKAYTIKYERYIEKDYVLITYVLLAVALTPVALIILRYKNIR